MHKHKIGKRLLSSILCLSLMVSGFTVPAKKVQAETTKQLGTAMITDPMTPNKNTEVWTGNYVYFGKYNGQIIRYRVLDANTTDYSADGKTQTMLLDCDRVLYTTLFNQDTSLDASGKYANDWSVSDIKTSLNGADFLTKDGVFTDAERNAIAESTVGSHVLTTDSTTRKAVTAQNLEVYENYVALSEDKVFLLDVEDVCNEAYGYTRGIYWDILGDYYYGRTTRAKQNLSNKEAVYWLRSAQDKLNVGSVTEDSTIGQYTVNYTELGVSPAFNLNLSSVLFTTNLGRSNVNGGTMYKLTLIDSEMIIEPKGVTKSGSTVTIPYTLSGDNSANATQISVMVLDKEYAAGNTNNATMLDYQKLTNYATAGTVTYTIPDFLSGKKAGTDYHIYVLAEDIQDVSQLTDYASEPVEIHLWDAPTVKAMHFGTKGIIDPAIPNGTNEAWKGCYVYLGNYNSTPVKYRVLDANTTDYSADGTTQTVLLDCDTILFAESFGSDANNYLYKSSQLNKNLNGASFYNKDGVFTNAEKNAIAESTIKAHVLTTDSETGVNVAQFVKDGFEKYVALNGEKIFLLDAEDVSNDAYGYHMLTGTNRKKTGNDNGYWLRSYYGGMSFSQVGKVSSVGGIASSSVTIDTVGVSPALNLKLSSVLFSSASAVSKSSALTSKSTKIGTTTNTDWKLTLKDDGKSVAVAEGGKVTKRSDGTITVPYTYTDNAVADAEKVNQISIMITDKAYGNNAEILYYGALDNIKNTSGASSTVGKSTSGTGTFALPSDLTGIMGKDYHVYLLAEHVSAGNGTDCASEPLEIIIKSVVDTTTLPTVADRTYHPTKALVDSDIIGGEVKDQAGTVIAGAWSFKEQNIVPSVGNNEYEVIFTPTDTVHYETITKMVTVNVTKATPVIVTKPIASDIVSGSALQDSALSGGMVQLSATDTIEVAGTFSWKDATVIPLAKDSGVTEYAVVFTPADLVNYNVVETTVTVVVRAAAIGTKDVSDDGKATYKVTKSDLEKGTVTYVGPTNKKASTVTIPDTVAIDGVTYKVTAIEKNAFKNNKYIKSITIGKNVKTIGANAFYKCTKLKTVKFGKNVTTIGDKAFYKCTALTKISLPSKVKTIGKSAFYGCKKVETITLGKSVAKIGSKAFYGCSKVKTLTIKSTKLTTKKIGSKAFSKTPKSMTVKVPKKKYKAYKSLLVKRGVNKKAKFKKI